MQVNANIAAINNASKTQEVSANNIANVNSNDFKASRAVQSGDQLNISPEARAAMQNTKGESISTTDPAQDMVQMSVNQRSVEANVAAIKTQEDMQQALLAIKK
ncbi:hypothetical protein D8Y20_13430 [Mariprofundus sp. EBB-1]|uniref:flagellar basal body rod C-terminal domain-containing protein n=1 Tax=Mariprofundus sp. EBB-1 TaxID=2650971 RepID=UPI000EF1E2FE|nr:hypothetical protein [Mariprofundus sp. EBB-1]RLL48980.1 hypothetical protein D8Y20_13430 [Mariprofundus sp. EBB-1]